MAVGPGAGFFKDSYFAANIYETGLEDVLTWPYSPEAGFDRLSASLFWGESAKPEPTLTWLAF